MCGFKPRLFRWTLAHQKFRNSPGWNPQTILGRVCFQLYYIIRVGVRLVRCLTYKTSACIQFRPFIGGLVSAGPSSGWGCQTPAKGFVCRQVWGPWQSSDKPYGFIYALHHSGLCVYKAIHLIFSHLCQSRSCLLSVISQGRLWKLTRVTRTGIEPKNTDRIDLDNNGSKPSVKMLFFP